jgi:hypothetical protein
MKKGIALFSLMLCLFSCGVSQELAKQATGLYAISQCKYVFQSITELVLAGINMQNAKSITSNPLAAANLLTAFASPNGSLPVNFTLNLDVTNPGVQTALLNGANYILDIDGNEMTQGSLANQLQVGAGQKATLPINISFDLKKAMSGKSLDAIKNLAYNFAGIGNASSNVTLKLKPSMMVNGYPISAPDYIPISFSLH